jgi:hypothetical protein
MCCNGANHLSCRKRSFLRFFVFFEGGKGRGEEGGGRGSAVSNAKWEDTSDSLEWIHETTSSTTQKKKAKKKRVRR